MKALFKFSFLFLLCAGLWWPAVRQARESLTRSYWFEITGDESYHAEAIERLATTGSSTTYQGSPFLASTGPTVLAPAALLSRATEWPAAVCGRIVVLCFSFILLLVLSGPIQIGFFFWTLIGLSDWGYYTFGIMGEVAGVTCMGALYLALKKELWFPSGLLCGFAVLSKPFFIFLVPTALLFSALSQPREARFRRVLSVLSGGGIVLAAWLLLLYWSVGTFVGVLDHIQAVVLGINQITGASEAAQSAATAWGGLGQQVSRHFYAFPSVLAPRSILLLACVLIFAIYRPSLRVSRAFLLYSAAHLIWWFFLSPGSESRYLLPAVAAVSFVGAFELARLPRLWPKFWASAAFSSVLVLLLAAGVRAEKQISNLSRDPRLCSFCRQLKAQDYWAKQSASSVFSISNRYPHDQDYLLTRAYQIEGVFDSEQLQGESPIVVGEHPDERLKLWVKENCKPTFLVGVDEGFWSCKK